MQIGHTPIEGLLVFTPRVFSDDRGYFMETFREDFLRQAGVQGEFVQDNESCSSKGVLRGLHFQAPPFAQGKLVRVISGAVYDVAVDIRRSSPTFGKYFGLELSAENKKMFWIPPGFAHGFLALEDHTVFVYKCTGYYDKASEGCLRWNDPSVGISWPLQEVLVSPKDQEGSPLNALNPIFP